jgi:hypothetical protein
LVKSGWFFNIDEVKTIYHDAYLSSLKRWINHSEKIKEELPHHLLTDHKLLKEQLEKWKARNIDKINIPKTSGDDIHESFLKQLRWLKKIGFNQVDIFLKYHLWALIGGEK